MMQMKTTDDMGKIITLRANFNRNFVILTILSSKKCSNSMDGYEMQNYQF